MPSLKNCSFRLELIGVGELDESVADKLYEHGCDDALLLREAGRVILDFDRAAEDTASAVRSAMRDVQQAGFGVAAVEMDNEAVMFEHVAGMRLGRVENQAAVRCTTIATTTTTHVRSQPIAAIAMGAIAFVAAAHAVAMPAATARHRSVGSDSECFDA